MSAAIMLAITMKVPATQNLDRLKPVDERIHRLRNHDAERQRDTKLCAHDKATVASDARIPSAKPLH
jgi:hypothetical protein